MNDPYWEEEVAVATFPPALRELPVIRHFVAERARDRLLSEDKIRDLELAVSEACVNAIQHAGDAGPLRLEVYAYSDQLAVEITHDGSFTPLVSAEKEHDHRGFGLPLMAALADGFSFTRFRRGGTRVVLSFRLPSLVGAADGDRPV